MRTAWRRRTGCAATNHRRSDAGFCCPRAPRTSLLRVRAGAGAFGGIDDADLVERRLCFHPSLARRVRADPPEVFLCVGPRFEPETILLEAQVRMPSVVVIDDVRVHGRYKWRGDELNVRVIMN